MKYGDCIDLMAKERLGVCSCDLYTATHKRRPGSPKARRMVDMLLPFARRFFWTLLGRWFCEKSTTRTPSPHCPMMPPRPTHAYKRVIRIEYIVPGEARF